MKAEQAIWRSIRHSTSVRNNLLASRDWSVLRFNSYQLTHELPDCLGQVRATINTLGGLVTLGNLPRRFGGDAQAVQLPLW